MEPGVGAYYNDKSCGSSDTLDCRCYRSSCIFYPITPRSIIGLPAFHYTRGYPLLPLPREKQYFSSKSILCFIPGSDPYSRNEITTNSLLKVLVRTKGEELIKVFVCDKFFDNFICLVKLACCISILTNGCADFFELICGQRVKKVGVD